MARHFLGKCSIITGSTSGIGLGIARKLAENGSNIVLNGFGDEAEVKNLLSSFKSDYNVVAIHSNADMTKPNEIRDMISTSLKEFGKISILVNNAGIQHVSPIENFDDEMYEKMIKINLSAPFYAIKAAFPIMKREKFGRIINIASTHGLVASVNKAPYVSSKHGVIGLTKSVALEGANFGITCNVICPGWVLTDLVRKQIDELSLKNKISFEAASKTLLEDKQPLHRFVKPEEIGDAVLFLSGPSSDSITGACLEMSGGWTAR